MPVWMRLLLLLATAKIAAGGVGFFVDLPTSATAPRPFPLWINLLHIVVFGCTAACLIFGGRRDRRAQTLGTTFVLVSAMFADTLVLRLEFVSLQWLRSVGAALALLQPDVFLPLLLWMFVREFPAAPVTSNVQRIVNTAISASAAIGLSLAALNTAPLVVDVSSSFGLTSLLGLLGRHSMHGHFWTLLILLCLPALPFALWKTGCAPAAERHRVGMFLASFLGGSAPLLVDALLEAVVPPFGELMARPIPRQISGLVIYPLLLSIPITTAYSVLVNQVLDVRLVIRRALSYALARYTLLMASALPFIGLVWYLHLHREDTLGGLLSGPASLLLLGLTATGLIMARYRRRFLDSLDRRFFREQYDAKRALTDVVQSTGSAGDAVATGRVLRTGVDRALHLERVAVFICERAPGLLRDADGVMRSLPSTSVLAGLLVGGTQPLVVDLENETSVLRRLPDEEREWLVEGAFRLVAPLLASDGALIGLLALGAKKSELPFTREDREFVFSMAASGALALENRLLASSPSPAAGDAGPMRPAGAESRADAPSDEEAGECDDCHAIEMTSMGVCRSCGGRLAPAPVPKVLLGKFRLERRIGAGGMGVVYRAVDLTLDRTVAIKTLPRASPEHCLRLRREARTVAAVVHPNLATIFGVETWRGTPVLVFEFVGGGTLADRIRRSRLAPLEVTQIGLVLASVMERTHAAGILHRDIKPSNIGFSAEGVLKLLDFGVARMMLPVMQPEVVGSSITTQLAPAAPLALTPGRPPSTDTRVIVGTPPYLSPEAARGEPAEPSFDLWSINMVLFEALAGKNPVLGVTAEETLARVSHARVPDIREFVPDCPATLAEFFHYALAADPRRRPATASGLKVRLAQVRQALST